MTANRVQDALELLRREIDALGATSMNVGGPGSRSIKLLDEILEIIDRHKREAT